MAGTGALKFEQKEVPLDKLHYNPENFRFRVGTTVDGVKLPDTYNLGNIKDVIREQGGVPGRIVVEEFVDGTGPLGNKIKGKYWLVLAGNRRTLGAQELVNDPTTPQGLRDSLLKVACNVYKDLEADQRYDLINDQQSEGFKRAEIVIGIWRDQQNGYTPKQIGQRWFNLLFNYTGQGAKMRAKIGSMKTKEERDKAIQTWLKGTLELQILAAGKMGPRVRRAFLLRDLLSDGTAQPISYDSDGKPQYEQPEFQLSQGRCSELLRDMKEDGNNWTPEKGGPKFNDRIDQYIREDNRLDVAGQPLPPIPVRQTTDKMAEQKNLAKSSAAKAIMDLARGERNDSFVDLDNNAFRLEQIEKVLLKLKDGLKDPIATMAQIVLKGDALEMESFLAKFSK